MSKEETEAYLKRAQEMSGMPLAALVPEGALDPGAGVTAEEITAWEQEHGVRLPDVLRQALARQNGGYVRDSQFRVWPLEEIVPPDDEFWSTPPTKRKKCRTGSWSSNSVRMNSGALASSTTCGAHNRSRASTYTTAIRAI